MSIGKMRIYGCGGAGVNVARYFANSNEVEGCAAAHPVFLDTSRSNLTADIDEGQCFILQNVDGSGKVRRENHQEIANSIRQVLLKHKPMDFNVVVFSASGGSGSVFGPLLVSELLERDEPVVAVVIGSDESAITATNTLNTLKSLDAISNKTGRPVVMYYAQNDRAGRRSAVDSNVQAAIAYLAVLASRQNGELDTRDISNWLQYQKTTSARPQLSLLLIARSDAELVEQCSAPISVASIFANPDLPGLPLVPDYHCAGYAKVDMVGTDTLHFAVSVDEVPLVAQRITKTLNELEEVRQSRVSRDSLVGAGDQITDGGLVL